MEVATDWPSAVEPVGLARTELAASWVRLANGRSPVISVARSMAFLVISWPEMGGLRRRVTYCYQPGLYGGLVLLFRTENAELVAIMNDGFIQHMRVGATAALGARYLARSNAETVGIIGSGGMARSFALGFAAVRKLR